MASQVSICNMALSHLGVSSDIQSIDERSTEAAACKLFFDQARDEVLRDFAWPFATRFVDLALVSDDPTAEWKYAYRFPADAVRFVRLVNDFIPESQYTVLPFRIGSDDTGRLIYTARQSAEAEFVFRVTDPNLFPPDFIEALSLMLAAQIAPRVTGGDQFKLGDRALGLYQMKIAMAKVNAANEDQQIQPAESTFVTIRE